MLFITVSEVINQIQQLIELRKSEASYRPSEVIKSLSVADL